MASIHARTLSSRVRVNFLRRAFYCFHARHISDKDPHDIAVHNRTLNSWAFIERIFKTYAYEQTHCVPEGHGGICEITVLQRHGFISFYFYQTISRRVIRLQYGITSPDWKTITGGTHATLSSALIEFSGIFFPISPVILWPRVVENGTYQGRIQGGGG